LGNGEIMEECGDGRIAFTFDVSKEITISFEKYLCEHGATPAAALSVLAGILLYRYCGETHIHIQVGVRDGELIEVNVNLEETPTVRHLLRQMCENTKSLNLEKPEPDDDKRDDTIHWVFPQHLMRPLMRVSDVGMNSDLQAGLVLSCSLKASHLYFTFRYEKKHFADEMIAQMAEHFQNLMKAIIDNADSQIMDLQMLSPEEIHKIVYEWNHAPIEYETKCFQTLFDDQVTMNPHAPILLDQDRALTYGELNSRANGVAEHLRRIGAGPEVAIGIGMGRSLDAITALVGVLKTGAAFCVIDPEYPITRIDEMVQEAGAAIILTRSENAARYNMSGSKIVPVDSLFEKGASLENISCKVKMENAAYVTFTSGSTGKAKGVIATHRSIALLYKLGCILYSGKSSEVFCLNTPLGFSSVANLLMALCCGFPMVVIPNGQEKDPRAIALAIQQHRVTNLSVMPSFLRQLFSLGNEGKMMLDSIKRVTLTGSEITWDLVEPFRKLMPDAKLGAGYASSETCAIVLGNLIDFDGKDKGGRVALGRPGLTGQVLVLDQNLNPVPIGAPGELYVGSTHLARGYIGRPDLTAECFLPNPFGRSPGERMYRTGDIVRYRFDGKIEFMGRSDNQVKIRGFRVELEEIEAALTKHPDIKEATVIADKNETTERLVAYIVRKNSDEMDTQQLRRYLEQNLPFYMVPSIFMFLDRLPMTTNGKIDHNALQSTAAKSSMPDRQCDAATDPIQEALIEIWQELIGVNKIGIHDEFLDLGGDSLVAALTVMHIRKRFDVEIPLPLFFEGLTIEALAVEITKIRENDSPLIAQPLA
jgi:amino acid adenylation domain-containing protein